MTSHRIRIGNSVLDLATGELSGPNGGCRLSGTEAALVAFLARSNEAVVPKEKLLREVWGYSTNVRTRTIDTTVSRLRKKLPEGTLTVFRGRGVQLRNPSVRREPSPPPIGREHIADALLEAVKTRGVLTLTGPPGVGKSHLAQWIAEHGGHFISIRVCRNANDLTLAVARALEVTETEDKALHSKLHGAILVLDGGTRIPADMVRLLDVWRNKATLVITSEHPLGLPDERIERLEPLSETNALRMLDAMGCPTTSPALLNLVRSGERLPLELELLARVFEFFGPDDITEASLLELDDARFDRPYSSLRQALSRSWQHLSEEDQGLLAAISIFEEYFDVSAAAALGNTTPHQVIGGLQRLHRASLLSGEGGVFTLHSSVRSFAAAHADSAINQQRRDTWCAGLHDQWLRGNQERCIRHAPDTFAALATAQSHELAAILIMVFLFHFHAAWAHSPLHLLEELSRSRPEIRASSLLVSTLIQVLSGEPLPRDLPEPELADLRTLYLAMTANQLNGLDRYRNHIQRRDSALDTTIIIACARLAPTGTDYGLQQARRERSQGRWLSAASFASVALQELLWKEGPDAVVRWKDRLIEDNIAPWIVLAAAELQRDNPEAAIQLLERGLRPEEKSELKIVIRGLLATVLLGMQRTEEATQLVDDQVTGPFACNTINFVRRMLGLTDQLKIVPPPFLDWEAGRTIDPKSPAYVGFYFQAWLLARWPHPPR